MLASLLPGLRDVRTPLSVGLVWLTLVWVLWGEQIPDLENATGLSAQLYRVFGVFGTASALTVVAFSGYILGILLGPLNLDALPLRYFLPNSLQPSSWQSRRLYLQRVERANARGQFAARRYREIAGSRGSLPDDLYELEEIENDLVYRLHPSSRLRHWRFLERDVRLMAMRLQSTQAKIYDDYDRLQSEAEFRRSIALPLSLLVGSLFIRTDLAREWSTASGVIAGAALFGLLNALSWRKSREGNDLVIQSMEIGEVQSPTIEALNAAAESIESRLRG